MVKGGRKKKRRCVTVSGEFIPFEYLGLLALTEKVESKGRDMANCGEKKKKNSELTGTPSTHFPLKGPKLPLLVSPELHFRHS